MPPPGFFDLFHYALFQKAFAASLLGGAACGLVGVWVVLLNIPFIGVAMSHAALAGAVAALLAGVNPLAGAAFACTAGALTVSPLADRGRMNHNTAVGVLFSVVLCLSFLGMGLLHESRREALAFLWGGSLGVSRIQVVLLASMTAALIVVSILFHRPISAVLYHRQVARAVGIPDRKVLNGLLLLCGGAVSLTLNAVGGLLVISLITIPPLAALQWVRRFGPLYVLSAAFGAATAIGGLVISNIFNRPSGASSVLVAGLIFDGGVLFRRGGDHE